MEPTHAHDEAGRRQHLIEQAIQQELTAPKLARLINSVHERPQSKDLRVTPPADMPMAPLGGCIRGLRGELSDVAPRQALLDRLTLQQLGRVTAAEAGDGLARWRCAACRQAYGSFWGQAWAVLLRRPSVEHGGF